MLVADAESEKATRGRTNKRFFELLDGIDTTLRGRDGNNGIVSRVKLLEIAAREEKKVTTNAFNRVLTVLSLVASVVSLIIIYNK